jgi:hypothetical protein
VKPAITSAADLKERSRTPSLGNTQDAAPAAGLAKGYQTSTEGGGDVDVVPQELTTVTRSRPARSTVPGCPSRTPRSCRTKAARCRHASLARRRRDDQPVVTEVPYRPSRHRHHPKGLISSIA